MTKKVFPEESSEDEITEIPTANSSSDDDNYFQKLLEDSNNEMEIEDVENTALLEGDFVLVELKGKKSVRHYIAEIKKNLEEDKFEIVYLKKVMNSNKFVKTEEIYEICNADVVKKLPKPTLVGGSERRMEQLYFSVDFMSYNM